jgi:hypothetical protein
MVDNFLDVKYKGASRVPSLMGTGSKLQVYCLKSGISQSQVGKITS